MTVARRTKRSTPRFKVPTKQEATVELIWHAEGGRPCSFPLEDISISGISFLLPEDLAVPENGTELNAVELHFPHAEIAGDLLVMHSTVSDSGRVTCGSLFYPASEDDLMKLKTVVAGFEVARSLR